MTQNFQRGDLCPVRLILAEAEETELNIVTYWTLNVRSHTLDLSAAGVDTTNHTSGGAMARICGNSDVKGDVVADFDLDEPPYLDPPAIIPGRPALIMFHVSPDNATKVPVRIVKLHFESMIETAVRYAFSVELDADNDLGEFKFHQSF